ncbi:uncharacterized protein [Salminus brasiliensis]|uniref:uncharacterized protein isoform X3 n=1 Tax=Salminus brasiliensis TaxID=930266 RepID=UPI003B82EC91
MVQCFVAECDHSYSKSQCSFFRLPSDAQARRTWEKLSGRPPDCSNENSRICSCHFIGGVKAAGPSLFKWNRERLSHLQAAERGVKEEPEEKDIVSPQGGPGRPTDDRSLLKAAVDSAHAGDEVLEDAMAHFKEEETESETKSDAEAEADSSGNLRDC